MTTIRFTRYRRIFGEDELTKGLEQRQARGMFVDHEDFDDYFIEVVDVVDDNDTVLYEAYFGAIGGMRVFRSGTEELVAHACQHEIDKCEPELRAELAAAYKASNPKIVETIVFRI